MSKLHRVAVIGTCVSVVLIAACSSSGGETSAESSTTSSAMTAETTATTSDTPTTAASVAELPNPCEAFTADEFNTATGLTTTAEVDEYLPTACSYLDADQIEVAVLTVRAGAEFAPIIDSTVNYPAPGVTYTTLDLGEIAAVTGPPATRGMLVADGIGYDFTNGFSTTPLTTAQMTALLEAAAA